MTGTTSIKILEDKNHNSGIVIRLNHSKLESEILNKFNRFEHLLQDVYITNRQDLHQIKNELLEKDLIISFNHEAYTNELILNVSPVFKEINSNIIAGHQRHLKTKYESESVYNNISNQLSLGSLRKDISHIEPLTRMCSTLNFSLSSIKTSEVPGELGSFPTGLFTEEAAQIFKYCGVSSTIKHININYDSSTELGVRERILVIITLIWYAAEGRANMILDSPLESAEKFDTYLMEIDNIASSLIFYKHKLSAKWWVMLEGVEDLIPCSYEDYATCLKGQISDYITFFLLN